MSVIQRQSQCYPTTEAKVIAEAEVVDSAQLISSSIRENDPICIRNKPVILKQTRARAYMKRRVCTAACV